MKRTFTYVLLLALLGGASLWAYNNTLDNSDYFTPNEKWGKRESQDGIGTLETYARSVADSECRCQPPIGTCILSVQNGGTR